MCIPLLNRGGSIIRGAHTGTIFFFAASDAVVALQMTVQGENSENTDVNRDGRATSLDALTILQAAACSVVIV